MITDGIWLDSYDRGSALEKSQVYISSLLIEEMRFQIDLVSKHLICAVNLYSRPPGMLSGAVFDCQMTRYWFLMFVANMVKRTVNKKALRKNKVRLKLGKIKNPFIYQSNLSVNLEILIFRVFPFFRSNVPTIGFLLRSGLNSELGKKYYHWFFVFFLYVGDNRIGLLSVLTFLECYQQPGS